VRFCALLALALVLAGCGGEGGSGTDAASSGADTTPDAGGDRASYIAAGDAICRDAQAEAAQLLRSAQELQQQAESLGRDAFLAKAADFWDEQIAFAEDFRSRFAELDPPEADESRHAEFLASVDEGVELGREIQGTLEAGQPVPDSLTDRYAQSVAEGNELARTYGFEVCGRETGR